MRHMGAYNYMYVYVHVTYGESRVREARHALLGYVMVERTGLLVPGYVGACRRKPMWF